MGSRAPREPVAFVSDSHGWAVGASSTILATTNGGTTWTAQPSGTSQRLWGVVFVSDSHGWAVGESGTILAWARRYETKRR
jgi:photosystem II stability/assembly factor-like uncharacterized protein